MKIYEWQASSSFSPPPSAPRRFHDSSRVPLACLLFMICPKWRARSRQQAGQTTAFWQTNMIPYVRKSKAILDSGFRKQNLPGFCRITKAKIPIFRNRLPYTEWVCLPTVIFKVLNKKNIVLWKILLSWIRLTSIFKFSAPSDLCFPRATLSVSDSKIGIIKKNKNNSSSFTKFKCTY